MMRDGREASFSLERAGRGGPDGVGKVALMWKGKLAPKCSARVLGHPSAPAPAPRAEALVLGPALPASSEAGQPKLLRLFRLSAPFPWQPPARNSDRSQLPVRLDAVRSLESLLWVWGGLCFLDL